MIRIHCAPRIAALHRSNIVITTYFSRSHHPFNPRGPRVPKCPKPSLPPPVLEEKFHSIRGIDLEKVRKIHSAIGYFFCLPGEPRQPRGECRNAAANLYASTVFDFNENLRWVSPSLPLSLSLSPPILRIGRVLRPLLRQINGYMAYRKVVFADEQANGQTNGQMHARVRIGGFSAAKFIAPTYSREYGRARLERRGGGYRLRTAQLWSSIFLWLTPERASERASATPMRRNAESW